MLSRVTTEIDSRRLLPADWHFNAAIFERDHQFHLCYRLQSFDHELQKDGISRLAIASLDDELQPIRNHLLETPTGNDEDPRVIVGRTTYLAYNHNYTQHLTVLDEGLQIKDVITPQYAGRKTIEKNWMWFQQGDDLFCIYSIVPRWIVLKWNTKFEAEEIVNEEVRFDWPWGELRGGTSPIQTSPTEMHMFMHSVFDPPGSKKHLYVAGYIGIDARTFMPTSIGRYPCMVPDPTEPRVGSKVVFPCGAVKVEDDWLISYGHHDTTIRIDRLKNEELLHDMHIRPVSG